MMGAYLAGSSPERECQSRSSLQELDLNAAFANIGIFRILRSEGESQWDGQLSAGYKAAKPSGLREVLLEEHFLKTWHFK